jgi:hypothetical protein
MREKLFELLCALIAFGLSADNFGTRNCSPLAFCETRVVCAFRKVFCPHGKYSILFKLVGRAVAGRTIAVETDGVGSVAGRFDNNVVIVSDQEEVCGHTERYD